MSVKFHRCFTRSHRLHVITVLVCCTLGFTVGCLLRAIPSTAAFRYNFVIGQNLAAISAVIGTGLLTRQSSELSSTDALGKGSTDNVITSPSHAIKHIAPCTHIHNNNRQFLEEACLGVHVDTVWHKLHEDVRRFLLNRVSAKAATITPAVHEWLVTIGALYQDGIPRRQNRITEAVHARGTEFELTSDWAWKTASQRRSLWKIIMHGVDDVVKWISVISGAAHDAPRELWYALNGGRLTELALWILLKFWQLCRWSRSFHTYVLLIAGKQPAALLLDLAQHGTGRILRRNLIMVDRPGGYLTGFVARSQGDLLGVMVHQGLHTEIPKTQRPLAVAFYDEENRLYRRHELESKLEIVYHYDERSSSRWPVSKTTIYSDRKLETRYDSFGRPISGQQLRNGTVFDYEYRYKHQGVGDLDLVCATYKSVDDTFPALLTVYWYVESDKMEQWIPSNKVQAVRAVFSSGQMYEIRWIYKHARGADVEASVYLDGVCRPCFPPPEIVEETFGLLDKPTQFYFDDEDRHR
jgi:hypothetical protein